MKGGTIFLAILIITVIAPLCSALDTRQIESEINNASSEVSNFLTCPREDIVIITGSRVSMEDRIIFNMIKATVPNIQGIKIIDDDAAEVSDDIKGKTLVLVGSEKTNLVSRSLVSQNAILDSNTSVHSPLIMGFAVLNTDKKVLMLYSQRELLNNENKAAQRSVLARFMDPKYVPAVATFLSVLMLYIWARIGQVILSLFNDFVSSKILGKVTAGKKVGEHKKKTITKIHEFLTGKEILAYTLAVAIFSFTMTWTWAENLPAFWEMLLLNLGIVAIVTFAREAARLFFCYKKKIRSEYVFWPFGAFLTVASTVLGNTFSLATFTITDDSEIDQKKLGMASFIISAMTLVVTALAYVLNIIFPSVMLQMVFVYCIMVLVIELFPIEPMAGNDIKKWNLPAWAALYLVVIASYVYMNFTVYF